MTLKVSDLMIIEILSSNTWMVSCFPTQFFRHTSQLKVTHQLFKLHLSTRSSLVRQWARIISWSVYLLTDQEMYPPKDLNKSFSAERVLRHIIQKLNSLSVAGLGEEFCFYVDPQFESYFNNCSLVEAILSIDWLKK